MAKYEAKTKPTDTSPADFVAAIEHPVRRADGEALLALMNEITGEAPRMWGGSIVGYGQYAYRYASGHSGVTMKLGFSPRKANLVLYVLAFDPRVQAPALARLGKHRRGVGCLYVNKLADVDLSVLRELITDSWTRANARPDQAAPGQRP